MGLKEQIKEIIDLIVSDGETFVNEGDIKALRLRKDKASDCLIGIFKTFVYLILPDECHKDGWNECRKEIIKNLREKINEHTN